jgi:hypothetical protein
MSKKTYFVIFILTVSDQFLDVVVCNEDICHDTTLCSSLALLLANLGCWKACKFFLALSHYRSISVCGSLLRHKKRHQHHVYMVVPSDRQGYWEPSWQVFSYRPHRGRDTEVQVTAEHEITAWGATWTNRFDIHPPMTTEWKTLLFFSRIALTILLLLMG